MTVPSQLKLTGNSILTVQPTTPGHPPTATTWLLPKMMHPWSWRCKLFFARIIFNLTGHGQNDMRQWDQRQMLLNNCVRWASSVVTWQLMALGIHHPVMTCKMTHLAWVSSAVLPQVSTHFTCKCMLEKLPWTCNKKICNQKLSRRSNL